MGIVMLVVMILITIVTNFIIDIGRRWQGKQFSYCQLVSDNFECHGCAANLTKFIKAINFYKM
jgi:hypothetical protein